MMPDYKTDPSSVRSFEPPTLTKMAAFTAPAPRPADVILGQPQANCRYHGICRIDDPGVPTPKGCRGQKVTGMLDWYVPNYCRLTLVCNQLSEKLEAYHFGTGEIVLYRPQALARFWGRYDYSREVIDAGTYPVLFSAGQYLIRFRVR